MKSSVFEVERFIQRRFAYTNIDSHWLNGNCYYFAVILKARFPEAEIYYEPVEGHFVTKLNGYFYDATGRMTPYSEPIKFEDIKRDDPLWYERLVTDCIK